MLTAAWRKPSPGHRLSASKPSPNWVRSAPAVSQMLRHVAPRSAKWVRSAPAFARAGEGTFGHIRAQLGTSGHICCGSAFVPRRRGARPDTPRARRSPGSPGALCVRRSAPPLRSAPGMYAIDTMGDVPEGRGILSLREPSPHGPVTLARGVPGVKRKVPPIAALQPAPIPHLLPVPCGCVAPRACIVPRGARRAINF